MCDAQHDKPLAAPCDVSDSEIGDTNRSSSCGKNDKRNRTHCHPTESKYTTIVRCKCYRKNKACTSICKCKSCNNPHGRKLVPESTAQASRK